jgi:DNA polymerase
MKQFPTPEDFRILGLDAETFYSDDYSLRKMNTANYIHDPRFKVHLWAVQFDGHAPTWVGHEGMLKLSTMLDWSQICVVGHNLRFDGAILAFKYGIRPGLWVDTLGMARVVIGAKSRRHDLDTVAKMCGLSGKVRRQALDDVKGKRDLTTAETASLGAYSCDDISDTLAAFHVMRRQFPDREFWFLDWATRMFTEPRLCFNRATLEEAYAEEVAEKERLLAAIPYGKTQLSSNPQFAEILRKHGVEPPTKTSKTTGGTTYAFAKNDMDFAALREHDDPLVQQLVAARLAIKSTIKESRAMRFLDLQQVGPWSVPLNYAGAMNTNRLSGGDSQNPQNLSNGSKLRDAIEAPEGYVVVAVDSSGIELRTAAALAGEWGIIERAVQKQDEYARFASIIFGYPVNKKDHPRERKVGKVGVLSLGYQSGAKTYRGMLFAMEKLIEPIETCEQVVRTFRSTYSKYPILWSSMDKRMKMLCDGLVPPNLPTNPPITWDNRGYVSKYSGARVTYHRIHERMVQRTPFDEPEKAKVYLDMRKAKSGDPEGWATIYGGKATENLSQFLAREVVNSQTHRIWQVFGIRPALQVHDELVYVVPADKAEVFFKAAVAMMSGPIRWWPQLVTSASGGIARSYGDIDK